jgi:hypothetical protein
MVFVSMFVIFLMLAIIQFSFSDLFGINIWGSIAALKVMAICVDFWLADILVE